MNVRSATSADFDEVTRLLEALDRPLVTPERRAACQAVYDAQLADPAADHLAADDGDGSLVGICSLHYRSRLNETDPQAWIPDLIVDERARRRGVGMALLAEAEGRARAHGCNALTLESSFHREDAHRLYERFALAKPGWFYGKRLE